MSAQGSLLFVKDGLPTGVELTEQELEPFIGRVDLVTHNLPRSTSFTIDDVLATLVLGAREVNAFGPDIRYRLYRVPAGRGWPDSDLARLEIGRIDDQIRPMMAPRIRRGELTPVEAEAQHRHIRWMLFARRFAGDIHYVVAERER